MYLSKLVATCRKMCRTKKLIMHQYNLHHQWIYSSNFCEGLCCCLPMSRSAFARRYLSFLFYLIQYASILIDDRLVNNLLLASSDFNIFSCPKNCCKAYIRRKRWKRHILDFNKVLGLIILMVTTHNWQSCKTVCMLIILDGKTHSLIVIVILTLYIFSMFPLW